jgi:hypothetical protein
MIYADAVNSGRVKTVVSPGISTYAVPVQKTINRHILFRALWTVIGPNS